MCAASVPGLSCVQTVDSRELALELHKHLSASGATRSQLDVFLQVNTSAEDRTSPIYSSILFITDFIIYSCIYSSIHSILVCCVACREVRVRAVGAVCARGRRVEGVRGQPARGGPHVHREISARERRAVRPGRVGRVRCTRLPGAPFLQLQILIL